MTLLGILAAITIELPKQDRRFGRGSNLLVSDVLIIVGVGVGLLVVLTLITYVWMKSRRNRRRHVSGGEKVYRGSSHSESDENEPDEPELRHQDSEDDESDHSQTHSGKRRYKYRVRRRSHRSRNPTLSEVGGLPPVRTPDSGEPF